MFWWEGAYVFITHPPLQNFFKGVPDRSVVVDVKTT